jgi:threonine dehydratase
VVVPPFDDALVIAGQGTIGLELLEEAPDVATVVVPVGGGRPAVAVVSGGNVDLHLLSRLIGA